MLNPSVASFYSATKTKKSVGLWQYTVIRADKELVLNLMCWYRKDSNIDAILKQVLYLK